MTDPTPLPPASPADTAIEWRVSPGLVPYPEALAEMESRAEAIRAGTAAELIWLLEHPPLYTAGTSAVVDELLSPNRFPVYPAGRGGKYTYHGPGQRIGYVLLDLAARGRDVRAYVHGLEGWVIDTLAALGVPARREPGRIGIWTDAHGREAKVGAIGVRVRRWVSFHGFAVNIAPDLSHFGGIVPCGLPDFAVTSLADLGKPFAMRAFDEALKAEMPGFLGSLRTCPHGP
ncbi:lipoyl(octanoyl) transferase LipB [Sphingomonas prati]|uniref:Octanoyltransferase n=1 Tax=Sphingomonas prati TaxID=1843237 RepID=A0A7W9EZQ1_9SPHN|nr:lipoyl(octanoyl) transferase LipB [Sphingomonas prati]MBB5727562.1 lipoyl(octanoyl) transferase [Sphingomonas prati]GGE78934.1 octanoyltransferase [Sphingomonas prati]